MATVSFRAIQTLPPTPPKKAAEVSTKHAELFLEDDFDLDLNQQNIKTKSLSYVNLNTPPQSSPQQTDSGSSKQSRKVSFLPLAAPDIGTLGLRPVLPSKGLKSSKSILKLYDPSPSCDTTPDPLLTSDTPPTFRNMLESVLQMLEGADITSRQEAYRVLNNSLRAHRMVPDVKALREKIPLLEDFLRRDIVQLEGQQPTKDLSLPALKLATTLLQMRNGQARGLKPGFALFLVEQGTLILAKPNPRKDLAIHFITLLSSPQIYTKAVTADHTTQLLDTLQSIQYRISGKNVYYGKLLVYSTLARFCPTAMIQKPSLWLPHMFHGMLAENPELRDRAIETAIYAGGALGNNRTVAKSAFEMLFQEGSSGAKYHVYFEQSLSKSMTQAVTARHVPQIWGALMLLLRGEKDLLENWFCSTSWLKMIELCFNASDISLCLEALLAWNRTIFAVGSSISCKARIMQKLRTPIVSHLQRPKLASRLRLGSLSTLCALLYYAFRPGSTPENTGLCWRIFIHDTFTKILDKSSASVSELAKILSAMLASSTLRVWNVDRVMDTALHPFEFDEVPRLDAQWIRSNISSVSKVILLLLQTSWQSPRSRDDYAHELWTCFLKAIAEAGSKEIKLTLESRKAFAEVTNVMHRLWQTTLPNSNRGTLPPTQSLITLLTYVQSAVEILGPIHFADNVLTRTDSGAFEAAATPSRHTPPRSGHLQSPVLAILKLVSQGSVLEDQDASISAGIEAVLRPCWDAKGSRKLKLAFAKECSAILPPRDTDDNSRTAGAFTWHYIAHLTTTTLVEELSSFSPGNQTRPGYDFANVNIVLQAGLNFSDSRNSETALELLNIVSKCAKAAAGDAGVVVAVTEPMVKHLELSIRDYNSSIAAAYIRSILIEGFSLPSQRLLDHAKKALWDHPPLTHDPSGLGWLKSLYSSINKCLKISYSQLSNNNSPSTEKFLSALATFLRAPCSQSRSTIPGAELFLWNTSDGICIWIEDKNSKVFTRKSGVSDVRPTVEKLWNNVLEMISRFPLKSNAQLRVVEAVFCSGFQSRSKGIANSTISSWNSAFGAEERLEYPPKLGLVLGQLRSLVDIKLTTLPVHMEDASQSDVSEGDDRDDDKVQFPWLELTEESQFESRETSRLPNVTSSLARPRSSLLLRSTPESTPLMRKVAKASLRRTPPPRLRHDNSQVQYAAVEFSPLEPVVVESQMLTENQKEVRSRQRDGLNLFKDIRSSSPSSSLMSAKLSLSKHVDVLPAVLDMSPEVEEQYPAQDAGHSSDIDMIDSSPLSRSQRSSSLSFARTPVRDITSFRARFMDAEEDIPSSPPEITVQSDFSSGHEHMPKPNFQTTTIPTTLPTTVIATCLEKTSATENKSDPVEALEAPPKNVELPTENLDTSTPSENSAPDGDELILAAIEEQKTLVEEAMHRIEPLPETSSSFVADTVACDTITLTPETKSQEDVIHGASHALDDLSKRHEVESRKTPLQTGPNIEVVQKILPEQGGHQDLSSPPPHNPSVVADSFVVPDADSSQLNHPVPESTGSQDPSLGVQDAQSTLTNARRMIATHVLIPSPRAKLHYEDFSQAEDPIVISDSEETPKSLSKKRKSVFPSTDIPAKKQKQTIDESEMTTITVRPRSLNSPSLRSLMKDSGLLVNMKDLPKSPARSSQKSSGAQSQRSNTRKRSPVTIDDDDELTRADIPGIASTPRSGGTNKRQKLASPSQSSVASYVPRSPQRRSSRLSGNLAGLRVDQTHQDRSNRTTFRKSPLSSPNTSFQNDEVSSQVEPVTTVPEVEVVKTVERQETAAQDAPSSAMFLDSSFDSSVSKSADSKVTRVQTSQPDNQIRVIGTDSEQIPVEEPSTSQQSPWNDTTIDLTRNISIPPVTPAAPHNAPHTTSPVVHEPIYRQIISTPQTTSQPQPSPPTPPSLARSIVFRLRGILSDCKNLVLGSSEAAVVGTGNGEEEFEEMQDLAHELQGEILRAKRRGRGV